MTYLREYFNLVGLICIQKTPLKRYGKRIEQIILNEEGPKNELGRGNSWDQIASKLGKLVKKGVFQQQEKDLK